MDKKYIWQLIVNIIFAIGVLIAVLDTYYDVKETKKLAEENKELLKENAELWRDTFKILGSIEQYINDHDKD